MRLSTRTVVLPWIAILAACSAEPAAEMPEPTPVDPAAVRAQVKEFVSTWNGGDVSGLGAHLAPDAVLLQPDGAPLEGREAILAAIADNYDINLMQQTSTVDEVAAIGDMAYARGSWTVEPTVAAGEDMPSMSGKWSAIYKRGPDGGWQTWRWMWNQPAGQTAGVTVSQ
jgi:uncharacterized protein (TIGR02246 family)